MVDDRDKEREDKGQDPPSRPVTAAARRERRASARPAGKDTAKTDETAKSSRSAKKSEDKAKAKPKGSPDAETKGRGEHKGRPTPTRDRSKDAKVGLFSRLVRFLKEVVSELRKVIWPTRKQMITYTAVVLVFVAFMVAVIAGLDFALTKGVFALFG